MQCWGCGVQFTRVTGTLDGVVLIAAIHDAMLCHTQAEAVCKAGVQ